MLPKQGQKLTIFIGEQDKHGSKPLYEWIVTQAKDQGLAGATVTRGIEGFGAKSRLHSAKILMLSEDLPIKIEIIDIPEKIEKFLQTVDQTIKDGLATVENVNIRFYRAQKPEK